jgi:Tol biopolymer transport system component
MARKGSQLFAHLKIADIAGREFTELTRPEEPVDDVMPVWNPDGVRLAISRQYTDDRWTQGHQVYLLNAEDGTAAPLVVDEGYNSSFFEWDPSGENLVMMRFPIVDPNGTPEVWTYHLATGQLVKIASDAFHPRWVP